MLVGDRGSFAWDRLWIAKTVWSGVVPAAAGLIDCDRRQSTEDEQEGEGECNGGHGAREPSPDGEQWLIRL